MQNYFHLCFSSKLELDLKPLTRAGFITASRLAASRTKHRCCSIHQWPSGKGKVRTVNAMQHIRTVVKLYLGVSHGGEGAVDAGGGGGHCQQGRDGEGHPGRGRLVVQPEGHPGHTDSHEGRDVDGEDVV